MSCVNKSSKEFKDTCKRLNVSSENLEIVVHEYQNTEGNENSFPSDSYIMEKLKGEPTVTKSENVIKLWEKEYSSPKSFNSYKEAIEFKAKALRFFDEKSVYLYKNYDGRYTINIAKPSSNNEDVYFQINGKLNNRTELLSKLKAYYSTVVKDSARNAFNYANSVKNIYNNIIIDYDRTGLELAKKEASARALRIKEILGDLASSVYAFQLPNSFKVKVVINIRSLKELEAIRTKQMYEYVNSMDTKTLISEWALVESEQYSYDEDVLYHIKEKDIPLIRSQILKQNSYILEDKLDQAIKFLQDLENDPETNLFVKVCVKWLKNNSISLPANAKQVRQIFDLARKFQVNVEQFKSPIELQLATLSKIPNDQVIYGRPVDPFKIKEFRHSRTETLSDGSVVHVFDVIDDAEGNGRKAVSQVLADTSPKLRQSGKLASKNFSSPWCLATFNYDPESKKATRTESAEGFWTHTYTFREQVGLHNQIAFYNGFPVAFNASDYTLNEWWYYNDSSNPTLNEANLFEVRDRIIAKFFGKEGEFVRSIPEDMPKYLQIGFSSYKRDNDTIDFNHFQRWMSIGNEDIHVETSSYNGYFIITFDNYSYALKERLRKIKSGVPKSDISIVREYIRDLEDFKYYLSKELQEKFYSFINNYKVVPDSLVKEIIESARESAIKEYERILKTIEALEEKYENTQSKAEEAKIAYKKPVSISEDISEAIEAIIRNNITDNRDFDWGVYEQDLDYMSEEDLEEVTDNVNKNSNRFKFPQAVIHRLLQAIKDRDYASLYNKLSNEAVNSELETYLKDILQHYHFEVIESDAIKEVFGKDVLGALDAINKVVYLANEGDRNALTGVEEFSHAFVKLMGAVYHKQENRSKYPETKEYSVLRDLVTNTSLYDQVYNLYKDSPTYQREDGSVKTEKIKEEVLGQALAAVILERHQAKSKNDKTFFEKVKEWFNKVLLRIKAQFSDSSFLDMKLNQIADSILDGSYHKKFLKKLNDKKFQIQDYTTTIENAILEDDGVGLSILQDAVSLGGIITGSLAYRSQTPVLRKNQGDLHDIDIVFPISKHEWFRIHPKFRSIYKVPENYRLSPDTLLNDANELEVIKKFKEKQPDLELMYVYSDYRGNAIINAIVCKDKSLVEKFKSLTGNYEKRLKSFSKKEKEQIHLVDIFLNRDNTVYEDSIKDNTFNLRLSHFSHSFKAKLRYGRAKDIYDYQNLNPINRKYLIDNTGVGQIRVESVEDVHLQKITDSNIAESTKSKFEKFKAQNDSLREQFKSLEKYGLNDTELSEVAEDFVIAISNAITEYQSNPKKILEDFPELSTVDRSQEDKTEAFIEDLTLQFEVLSRTREGIVRLIGAEKLVDKVRKQLFSGVNMPVRLRKLGQNTGALLATAYSKFQELEDFVILGELGIDVNEASHENIEDVNNESDAESIRELYGDSQEHWQVNVRTLDVLENATFMVKRALSSCTQYDSKGKEKKSKLGIPKRVKAKDATSAILRWTRGSLSLSDMIDKIEAKVKEGEKWAEPILNRLKDKNGAEADFKSQFFKVFAKHFHKASVIVKEKGKYVIKTVNENPALREAKTSIKSLYNIGNHPLFKADKTVNESTLKRLKALSESLEQADTDKVEIITEIVNHLGYFILDEHVEKALQNPDAFNTIKTNIKGIIEQVDKGSKRFDYNPFEYSDKNSIDGYLSKLLSPIVEQFEDTAISSYYDNGKMYQSYITPSYMTKLMLKFKLKGENFNTFIGEEYGKFEWFFKDDSWRNDWLNRLSRASDGDRKKLLDHKTQLHFNKNYYMKGMSEQQYVLSVITEYFNGGNKSIAYYKMPLQSNKPASEFVSFYKYSRRGYEDLITSKLYDVALQELDRIKEVKDANLSETDPNYIKNYHGERGRQFVFLDFLNSYLPEGASSSTPLGVLVNKRLSGEEFSTDEAIQFTDLIKSTIQENIQSIVNNTISQWENQGIIDEVVKNIIKDKDLKTKEEKINAARALLNEFLWNDTLATTQLLQLTVTDPAYYKDTEDLQKRLAQLHSPGVRGNKDAIDYKGNSITDGFLRASVLKDVELNASSLKSNILENVEIALTKRIEDAEESEKEALKAYKEAILKQFKEEINVADAQSYSSPTSYRKKALIFGTWSQEKEDIYQKIKKGEATLSEIQEAMQPLKPFTYTQISKTINGKTIKVPIQHKTAEYLLVMADAIIGETDTGKPNLLRAIFNFMEESAEKNPKKGIDTVLFESSVKSGLHGAIGVADLTNNVEGEQLLKSRLEESVGNADAIPVEDYSIQQEVPLHYYEHAQVHGSQIRALLPSDLPLNSEFTFVDGKEIKTASREEFRKEYEENIAANIQESLDLLAEEFGLNEEEYNPVERRYLVSKALQREILSNSRYGVDLLKAVMIDENGNFTLPLQDPIHAKRIEQLINSIVKNRINKQTIPGGPVVQVSNFGMSKRLNVRFKDSSGNLIPPRDQFDGTDEEYKAYIKKHQYSIAYFECIAPASTKELLSDFMNEEGNIDVETLEKLNPDLLKAIGYRIPTEGKHSMQPLKIVGFAPREAGEVIILPYEITLISGSDYDVDKIYMMRKSLPIKRKAFNDTEVLLKEEFGKVKGREVDNFLKLTYGNNTREAYRKYPDIAKFFRENCFEVEVPTEGRLYRDNKIIDMTYSVLTHPSQMDRLLKPGGFEEQRRMGYYITALKLGYEPEYLDSLKTSKIKDLCYKQSNLIYFRDQAQFYKQNSIAGTILGIFASERSNHAYLEGDNLSIDKENMVINLGNYRSKDGTVNIDVTYDTDGNFIGDTLGNLVAAAADAVKDPVLNLMNINSTTANMLVTMIRIGIPFKTASLFLSSNTITAVLNTLNNKSLSEYTTLTDELTNKLQELKIQHNLNEDSILAEEGLSEQQLIENIQGKIDPSIEVKILNTALNLIHLSSDLSKVSKVTRLNSVTTAVGPLMSDNIIMREHFNNFPANIFRNNESVQMRNLLEMHPILKGFYSAYNIPKKLMPSAVAFSSTIQSLLNNLNANLHTKIYKQLTSNRELLNKFLDFVLNYSMVNGDNPAIDYTQLKYFIQKFPKEYALKNYKKVYPENQFIQSIQIISKNGEITLKLDTTGMDEAHKGELKNAWSDLYKKDPKLATYLYNYAYFKGGIGFNPKTFMGLLPNSLRLADTKRNAILDNLPQIILDTFLDQFIGNNSEEYKFIKYLGKDSKIEILKKKDGTYYLNSNTSIMNSDLGGYTYFKYKDKLYKLVAIQVHEQGEVLSTELIEIPILGNNNSYLEVSPEAISKASNLIEDNSDDLGLNYNQYVSEIEESDVQTLFSSSEVALAKAIKQMGKVNGWSTERVEARLEEIKKESDLDVKTISISKLKETIKASYEKEGITYDESKINEEFKKYC